MNIVLIKNGKVIENIESGMIEITADENKIIYDNGSIQGINADIYVLEQCTFEIGQELTDTEINSLVNLKDNYIKRTVEQELERKEQQIKAMQQVMNTILFGGGV